MWKVKVVMTTALRYTVKGDNSTPRRPEALEHFHHLSLLLE